MPRAFALSAKPRYLVISRSRVPPMSVFQLTNERTSLAPDCSRSDQVWAVSPGADVARRLTYGSPSSSTWETLTPVGAAWAAAGDEEGGGQGQRGEQSAGSVHRAPKQRLLAGKLECVADRRMLRGMATISFARGAPSLDIVDVEGLQEAAQRAFADDPAGTTAYGTSVGYVPLREWIAEQHGVETDQVLVTNGSMQADAFLFQLLVGAGRPRRRRVPDLRPHAAEPAQPRRGRADGRARDRRHRHRRARVAARARACARSSRT